jgi:HD superfamily phosphohydrolase
MAKALNLSDSERLLVSTAGLLHDVGHGPYSHTLEYLFNSRLNLSHTDLTKMIILGKQKLIDNDTEKVLDTPKKIVEILEKHDIDPEFVGKLICNDIEPFEPKLDLTEELPIHKNQVFFNDKRYLFQIIHSSIDADQIDYLLRDSHYTGVAHGVLDFDRLMQTLELHNNDLVVNKHGLSAVEGMLVARALMYSSVYFHKTVRIAELMLSRALERLEDDQLRKFITISEGGLLIELANAGALQKELVTYLTYRKLFKRVYYLSSAEIEESNPDVLAKLEDPTKRLKIEDELADRAGVPEGHVIIDVPEKELNFSEPRMHKTDIKILDDSVKPLNKYTPLARALRLKDIPDWGLMVVTDKKYRDTVIKVSKKMFQN